MITAASIALVAWIVLVFARGGFWRARVDAHVGAACAEESALTVYAVVPARNEAEVVGEAISSLVKQRFDGTLRIFLTDDASTDGTAEIARAAAAALPNAERLEIVRGQPLPEGWSGKVNAMNTGVRTALERFPAPDYWLFTDADIRHDPENLRELLGKARRDAIALVSLMVRLRCESAWERLLIPAFVFFFQKLYPFAWIEDRARRCAGAAGGCMLLSHDALTRIGGLQAIYDRLIDDCALAAAVKGTGAAIWLGLADRTTSIRRYDTLDEIWSMVKRTAYTQLNYSPLMLLGTVVGMTLLYIVPPVALLGGVATRDLPCAMLGALTSLLIAGSYVPTVRAYRQPIWRALTLPFAALLYTLMTVDSAIAHGNRRGGGWKGRYAGSHVNPSTRSA